jgi:hypothetical protein
MRPSLTVSLPDGPAAVADAMLVLASPEVAALAPPSVRRLAWFIAASQHGMKVSQRHRPANSSGRAR